MGHSWSLVCAVFLIALAVVPLRAEEFPAVPGPGSAFEMHRSLRQMLAERRSRDAASSVAQVDASAPVSYTNGCARVLNDRGQVAGDFAGADRRRGFFWSDGVAVDMGSDQGVWVSSLNNRGQVVGVLEDTILPFQWEGGVLRTLEVTDAMQYGIAVDINDRGLVAGVIGNSTTERAVVWDDGALHLLPMLDGHGSWASGINQHGQVAGTARVANGLTTHAVLWEDGAMIDLTPDAVLDSPQGMRSAYALAINDRGEVIGSIYRGDPNLGVLNRGFFWERGKFTEIAQAGSNVYLSAMNNRGQVVGCSSPPAEWTPRPFLWDRGVMTDLGLPEHASFGMPGTINDQGQVVIVYWMTDGTKQVGVWDRGTWTYVADCIAWYPTNFAVNKHGQVMGNTNDHQRPYLWDRGTMTYLLEGVVAANVDVEEASLNTKPGMSDPLGVRVLTQGSRAGSMELSLSLDRAAEVQVSLYDVTGRLLASRDPEHLGAGQSTLRWDPGIRESGLYFARVQTEAGSVTRKWTVLR
jgi:probable HAF family extracellular repeat protein